MSGLQISGSNPRSSAISPTDEAEDIDMETGAPQSPSKVIGKPPVAGIANKKKKTKS